MRACTRPKNRPNVHELNQMEPSSSAAPILAEMMRCHMLDMPGGFWAAAGSAAEGEGVDEVKAGGKR
ncbi:hypothetical protein GCM10027048_08910 [Hymenobacter coalescens]